MKAYFYLPAIVAVTFALSGCQLDATDIDFAYDSTPTLGKPLTISLTSDKLTSQELADLNMDRVQWQLVRSPAGSTATLQVSADKKTATIIPDKLGNYTFQLSASGSLTKRIDYFEVNNTEDRNFSLGQFDSNNPKITEEAVVSFEFNGDYEDVTWQVINDETGESLPITVSDDNKTVRFTSNEAATLEVAVYKGNQRKRMVLVYNETIPLEIEDIVIEGSIAPNEQIRARVISNVPNSGTYQWHVTWGETPGRLDLESAKTDTAILDLPPIMPPFTEQVSVSVRAYDNGLKLTDIVTKTFAITGQHSSATRQKLTLNSTVTGVYGGFGKAINRGDSMSIETTFDHAKLPLGKSLSIEEFERLQPALACGDYGERNLQEYSARLYEFTDAAISVSYSSGYSTRIPFDKIIVADCGYVYDKYGNGEGEYDKWYKPDIFAIINDNQQVYVVKKSSRLFSHAIPASLRDTLTALNGTFSIFDTSLYIVEPNQTTMTEHDNQYLPTDEIKTNVTVTDIP